MSRTPTSDAELLKALLVFADLTRRRCHDEIEARGSQLPPETKQLLAKLEEHAEAVRTSSAALLSTIPSKGTLTVVEAPDARLVGTIYALRGPTIQIGRNSQPLSGIELTDPEVSGQHATLDATREGHRMTDDQSTNGTAVNGERIESVVLRTGDRIRVGTTILLYEQG